MNNIVVCTNQDTLSIRLGLLFPYQRIPTLERNEAISKAVYDTVSETKHSNNINVCFCDFDGFWDGLAMSQICYGQNVVCSNDAPNDIKEFCTSLDNKIIKRIHTELMELMKREIDKM